MTDDENLVKLVRGFVQQALEAGGRMYSSDEVSFFLPDLERFAALVAAAEREACAQILDHNANACANNSVLRDVLQGNATAIRARSNT